MNVPGQYKKYPYLATAWIMGFEAVAQDRVSDAVWALAGDQIGIADVPGSANWNQFMDAFNAGVLANQSLETDGQKNGHRLA